MTDIDALLGALRAPDVRPAGVRATLGALFEADPAVGIAAALDLLAGEPRIRPSRGLLIDPRDDARRRWDCRVAATVALLDSPAGARVGHEVQDELASDADLAADVARLRTAARV